MIWWFIKVSRYIYYKGLTIQVMQNSYVWHIQNFLFSNVQIIVCYLSSKFNHKGISTDTEFFLI